MAAFAFKFNVGFGLDKLSNALAEFAFYVLERHSGIFYRIVQCRGGQKFLVASHGGSNRDSLHRVNYIRETLPLTFCPLVRLDRKNNRFVEN